MRANRLASTAIAAALVALTTGYAYAAEVSPAGGAQGGSPAATPQAAQPAQTPSPSGAKTAARQDDEDEAADGYGPGMMGGYGYGPGMMGGYGPGMHGGYGPGARDVYGPGRIHGYGPDMMYGYGPGMMGGYGPQMGPWMARMMAGCGSWMAPWAAGGAWSDHGGYQAAALNLGTQDVKNRFDAWLAWHGNPHLKLGNVKEQGADTITADIVTKDNSLVQRFNVNRHTGRISPAED